MTNVTIYARFRNGAIGALSFHNVEWIPTYLDRPINKDDLPLEIHHIQVNTDNGMAETHQRIFLSVLELYRRVQ